MKLQTHLRAGKCIWVKQPRRVVDPNAPGGFRIEFVDVKICTPD